MEHNNENSQSLETVSPQIPKALDASFHRNVIFQVAQSNAFNVFILVVIVLNAIVLGLETNADFMKWFGWYFELFDNIFLGIYLFEMVAKLYSLRMDYFATGWNIFDLMIVLCSLIAFIIIDLAHLEKDVASLLTIIRVFRAVRIIRFLKELKNVKYLRSLQIIIDTMFASVPTIGSIALLAAIFLYVFAVAAVILYGAVNPKKFGSVGKSLVSLFEVITLDRWSEIYTNNTEYPSIWILGFLLIIFETFVFENLFVAVIVNNLKGSRELIEIKNQKRIAKLNKRKLEDRFGSKGSLKKEKSDGNGLGQLFDEQHSIDNYYPPNLSNRLKELLSSYYMNLASIDHAQESYQRQQKVLDDLMDLAVNYQNKEFD